MDEDLVHETTYAKITSRAKSREALLEVARVVLSHCGRSPTEAACKSILLTSIDGFVIILRHAGRLKKATKQIELEVLLCITL